MVDPEILNEEMETNIIILPFTQSLPHLDREPTFLVAVFE